MSFKPKPRALHGDARFAGAADLSKHGLFKPSGNGIVVGKFNGKLVRLSGQQFVILAAPTRSGKGVGVVIPNLLEYQESIVVLDIKQENFDLTSGWRASQGHEVFLFNPFAEDRRTHRWNPLTYVSNDPAFRVSDLMSIAAMLYPDGSDDQKFWVSQARNAFMAFALYLFENQDEELSLGFPGGAGAPTLGGIYRLSSGDGTDLKKYLKSLSERRFLSSNARSAFANMLSQADETFASIMGTLKEPLNAWINPVLDAATSADDFMLTDLRKKKMTIYIGIQPNKLAESRLIINLLFSQIINLNTRELPKSNPELKYQCLLLMDEFTRSAKWTSSQPQSRTWPGTTSGYCRSSRAWRSWMRHTARIYLERSSPTTRCRSCTRRASSRMRTTIRRCWVTRRSRKTTSPEAGRPLEASLRSGAR